MKTYYIKTFGCQMNHSDSERIAGFLESKGFQKALKIDQANLAIFNTCGVRQMAEDRVYGQIHNLRLKTKNHKLQTVVLTGCLAYRKDVQRRLRDKVDLFFNIHDFEKFQNWISVNMLSTKYHIPNTSNQGHINSYLNIKPAYNSPFSAYVPIMTGCNNFCAYCVVPYARGREYSRPTDEILKEIEDLIKKGYKEIFLLGQNVNSYKFLGPKDNSKLLDSKLILNSKFEIQNSSVTDFPKLLKKINAIPGKFWIRFLTSHPKDMSDELIETIAKCKKVCEYVHLPIQAGDDEILRKMNRRYTSKHYLSLIRKIKSAFKKHKPNMIYSLTSDIIVGFPTETRKQFLKSAEIMEKVGYDMVYFGQYSPRPGTAAAKLKDNVSKTEKARREKYLNEILKKTSLISNKKHFGKILEVLVEKEKDGFYFGKTRTMRNVKLTSKKKNLVGKIIKAKIVKANEWNLEGITP